MNEPKAVTGPPDCICYFAWSAPYRPHAVPWWRVWPAPAVHKLYVSDEYGKTETVINVQSNRRVATIPLDGEAGKTQYDPISRHIFANVQTRRQLVEIAPATDRVVGRFDLPGAKGNLGLLIDRSLRKDFSLAVLVPSLQRCTRAPRAWLAVRQRCFGDCLLECAFKQCVTVQQFKPGARYGLHRLAKGSVPEAGHAIKVRRSRARGSSALRWKAYGLTNCVVSVRWTQSNAVHSSTNCSE